MSIENCFDVTKPHQWANIRFNDVYVNSLNITNDTSTLVAPLTFTDSADGLTAASSMRYRRMGNLVAVNIANFGFVAATSNLARFYESSALPAFFLPMTGVLSPQWNIFVSIAGVLTPAVIILTTSGGNPVFRLLLTLASSVGNFNIVIGDVVASPNNLNFIIPVLD